MAQVDAKKLAEQVAALVTKVDEIKAALTELQKALTPEGQAAGEMIVNRRGIPF